MVCEGKTQNVKAIAVIAHMRNSNFCRLRLFTFSVLSPGDDGRFIEIWPKVSHVNKQGM